jgi:hypothetical protein
MCLEEFISKQEKEFVFGRRHLANMMGKDPETFSQDDINVSCVCSCGCVEIIVVFSV